MWVTQFPYQVGHCTLIKAPQRKNVLRIHSVGHLTPSVLQRAWEQRRTLKCITKNVLACTITTSLTVTLTLMLFSRWHNYQ